MQIAFTTNEVDSVDAFRQNVEIGCEIVPKIEVKRLHRGQK